MADLPPDCSGHPAIICQVLRSYWMVIFALCCKSEYNWRVQWIHIALAVHTRPLLPGLWMKISLPSPCLDCALKLLSGNICPACTTGKYNGWSPPLTVLATLLLYARGVLCCKWEYNWRVQWLHIVLAVHTRSLDCEWKYLCLHPVWTVNWRYKWKYNWYRMLKAWAAVG